MCRFILLLALLATLAVLAYSQSCTVAQNCTRTLLNPNNPNTFVQCNSGSCVCGGTNNCFELNSNPTTIQDSCTLNTQCYTYTNLGECKSTGMNYLTAVLLQAFVGEVGAANFYIGRSDLAGGQLFLFLVLFIFPYFLWCASCCVSAACAGGSNDNPCGFLCGCMAVLLVIVLAVIVIIFTFAVPIWWVADLIIFALNQRPDSNGCMLNKPT